MHPRFIFRLTEAIYVLAALAVCALGMSAYVYINETTNNREYENLTRTAQVIAALIDPTRIEGLSYSQTDLVHPAYIALKKDIVAVKDANPDLRFVYLMAQRDQQILFIVDSEDPRSPDYSPPGQRYGEASPELYSAWNPETESVLEISEDRWGNWISAIAPIRNADGQTIAIVGLDQSADIHRAAFVTQVALVAFATLAVLTLLGISYALGKREQDLIEMKADFVAVASHELRTPLMSLRWELAELRKDASLSTKVQDSITMLYNHVCMLIDLSTSFLLTTSVDHGPTDVRSFAPLDASALVRDRVSNAALIARAHQITLTTNITSNRSAMVYGDADRLRLVFDNLISNAVKYSPPQSEVTISLSDHDQRVEFSIHDSGIGIPEKELATIFKGFQRATNALRAGVTGTGFGLYIAKRIIDAHKGTITCTSKEGHGTTFTVTLPRYTI